MDFKKIIDKGLALGIKEIEIYASTKISNTLKLFNSQVESYISNDILSISIRGLYNNKMGYVTTEVVDDETIDELLKKLIVNASILTSPEQEFIFEGGCKYLDAPETKADYDKYSFAEKVDLLKEMEKRALEADKRIVKVGYCQYSEVAVKTELINSKGINLKREFSYLEMFLGLLAVDGDNNSTGFGGDVNTEFAKIEKDRILKDALDNTLGPLNAGSIETGSYKVVFKNEVATQLLSAFSSIFSAESAIKKMSILTDKINTKVFGENIQIIDDPLYPDALIKVAFDDEGVPTKKKFIVENGVFNGFYHSLKTAHYFNCEPTGNGFKAGGAIMPAPINLVLLPGQKSREEVIQTVDKGIYITDVAGLHSGLNPISGAFNVQASGYYIEDGKINRPITLFVVSGNFFEMMNDVCEIGNDIEKRFTDVASPTICVNKLNISGK